MFGLFISNLFIIKLPCYSRDYFMANILIIDDDKVTLQQLVALINSFGHTPIPTVYATHIFDILNSEEINLMLMDIYMPEIDGLACLKKLKADEKFKTVPVIMLTSDTNEKLLEECFKNGAMDFINKPLEEVVLRARITSALSIQDYIAKLKLVNEKMNEFLGIVSHDLRSPLGTLNSTCQMLQKYPEDIGIFVPEMEKTTKRTLRLVDDLLDLVAIESGKMKMEFNVCDFSKIAIDALNESRFLADNKNIVLTNNIKQVADIKADYFRILQVLNNLLTNAIKFTKPLGEVIVNAVPKEEGLQVEVVDNGVGIEKGKIAELFNKNKNKSGVGTEGEMGTGLGLPLSQNIMRAHGTQIDVKSEINKGTTFSFILPWWK